MISHQLKSLRLARGLSLDGLAQILRSQGATVSKAALSKYERGQSSPPANLLPPIARALQIEAHTLFETPETKVTWTHFGKNAALSKREQFQITAQATACACRVRHYSGLQGLPPRIPTTTFRQAEDAANQLRDFWGLKDEAIISLVELLQCQGVLLLAQPNPEGRFDGLSGWIEGKHPVIVVNTASPDDRLRFTLAQELGHLVLNCDELEEKAREALAHRFASAFLLTRTATLGELGSQRTNLSLAELGPLERRYGVSIQAWLRRALNLEIISKSLYQRLYRELSSSGWRQQEPSQFDSPISEKTSNLEHYTSRSIRQEHSPDINVAERPLTVAQQLLQLPPDQRDTVLDQYARLALESYQSDADLTDFVADDFIPY